VVCNDVETINETFVVSLCIYTENLSHQKYFLFKKRYVLQQKNFSHVPHDMTIEKERESAHDGWEVTFFFRQKTVGKFQYA